MFITFFEQIGPRVLPLVLHVSGCEVVKWSVRAGIQALVIGLH